MQILQWMQEGCRRRLKTLHYCLIWCALLCIKDINCHLFSHYYVKIEFSWLGNRLVSEFMRNAECSRIAPGLLLNMFYAFILQISALSFIHHFNSFLPEALLMISKSILQYICKLKSWLFFRSFEFWYKKIFTFYAIQTFLYILPHAGRLRQNHLSFSLWHIAIRHMIPVTKRQCWAFDVILMKTSPIPSSTGGFRQEKLHLAVW